ncbi:uncharacterized protein LOC110901053 [Helianthus annuus]|uniref:uncharacterized protein LOC110901053 n=1 Tax=Helianthus annuus TaxID=4232 RepID=UPI000B901A97|nr:uncharacterized protein LOC110901053 [Helianthus annuus]
MPGFMEYVGGLCSSFSFHGPADLALATKLKFLKNKIRSCVAFERRHRDAVYNKKKEAVEKLEKEAELRDLRPTELQHREECKSFMLEYDRVKMLDYRQKARVKWAVEGDENTGFFHGVINANTSNNRINGLMVNGEWVSNPTVIKDKAFTFFAEKFKEPMKDRPPFVCPNLSRLTNSEAELLIEPFSLAEIKEAVWSCDGEKAPGPDGFNFKFIKRCWEGLKDDFMAVFEEFF